MVEKQCRGEVAQERDPVVRNGIVVHGVNFMRRIKGIAGVGYRISSVPVSGRVGLVSSPPGVAFG